MAESTLQAVNVAMRGGGYYSAVTKGAKDVIDGATPLVLDAIRRLPDADATTPFTLADMGCADGGTSLDMVRQAVAAVRERWPQRPITVVYTDQPRNDYNSLFRTIHGLTSLPTYLDESENLHVLASATSFYKQILPAGTLHLGFSATAMHWLSRKPCDITDHFHAVGASGAELAAFAAQGRGDWETILLKRARELVPGGRLVLVNFCKDEARRYTGNTGGKNLFDAVAALWRRFATEGVISREEYVQMTLPQYYKTVEEFTQPLTDKTIKGTKFIPILGVSIDDQFIDDPGKKFDLKQLSRLCTPVKKNEEASINNPEIFLLCYKATVAKKEPKHDPQKGAHLHNQFGQEQVDTILEAELCVPTTEVESGALAAPDIEETDEDE
jgi:hypothetical protein